MTPVQIQEALNELLSRDDDAFIIFNVGKRFFQFAGSQKQALYFSMPTNQFEGIAELYEIQRVMEEHEIDIVELPLKVSKDDPTRAGTLKEYGHFYERNTIFASHVACDLLNTFPFKGTIKLQRSWDLQSPDRSLN